MEKKLTGSLFVAEHPREIANIRYATGFSAPDLFIFLQGPKRKVLLVPALEVGRAQREATGCRVLSVADLGLPRERRSDVAEWIHALLKREKLKAVTVAGSFPIGLAEKLKQKKVPLAIANGPAYPERELKSPAEVKKIAAVQKAAAKAMTAAMAVIKMATVDKEGYLRSGDRCLESADLLLLIDKVLLEYGCSAKGTIAACGRQSADPHARGEGPLQAGNPIVIDIFPQHLEHGYYGDLTRTVVKGKPSPALRRMHKAVASAQRAALAKVRANVPLRLIHQTVLDTLTAHGFKTNLTGDHPEGFVHGTGHGLGLEIHEAPSIGLRPGRLRAGHVVTIEPGLYYPDIGGVRIEDTILVTKSGWQYLYPCPRSFML